MGMPHMTLQEALRLGVDLRTALGFERPQVPAPALEFTAATRISFGGKTLSVGQWSKATGIQRDTLRERLRAGWPIEQALTTPVVSSVERSRRANNRRIISRITKTFHAKPDTQPPGYLATSADSAGTGVGSIAHHLHQKEISE